MVINHAGYELTSAGTSTDVFRDYVLFYSSFAPTIFYFVTGVGYGISPLGAKTSQFGLLRKVLLLFAADATLWLAPGRWIGLDFLGFIALSMLILDLTRRSENPTRVATISLFCVMAIRFGLGPIVWKTLTLEEHPIIYFVVGNQQLEGISYVPFPWLAFPFAGFIFGRHIFSREPADPGQLAQRAVILGVASTFAAMTCFWKDALFYRWGSMSGAYLLAAFAVIFVAYAASAGFSKFRISKWLSLRGFRSLAIVPIHYFLILNAKLVPEMTFSTCFVLSLVFVATSFLLAAVLEKVIQSILPGPANDMLWCGIVAGFVLFVVAFTRLEPPFVVNLARYGLQLGMCALLIAPFPFSSVQLKRNESATH